MTTEEELDSPSPVHWRFLYPSLFPLKKILQYFCLISFFTSRSLIRKCTSTLSDLIKGHVTTNRWQCHSMNLIQPASFVHNFHSQRLPLPFHTSLRLPTEMTLAHSLVQCKTCNFTNKKLLVVATSSSQLTNPWNVQIWKHKLSYLIRVCWSPSDLCQDALKCNQYKANKLLIAPSN